MNKPISEMPDFEVEAGGVKVKMILEWRGSGGAFWNAQVGTRGIFRPAVEIDLEQARAVAAAVAEFDRRGKGEFMTKPTEKQIEAAASAIANARAGRRGAPEITNVLKILPDRLREEVMADAKAALTAAGEVKE